MRANLRRRLSPIQRKSQPKSQTRQVSTQVAVPACCARGRVINVKEKKEGEKREGRGRECPKTRRTGIALAAVAPSASVAGRRPRRCGGAAVGEPPRDGEALVAAVRGDGANLPPSPLAPQQRPQPRRGAATPPKRAAQQCRWPGTIEPDTAPPARSAAGRLSLASLYDGGGAHGGSFGSA
jgi:hypothetical protein